MAPTAYGENLIQVIEPTGPAPIEAGCWYNSVVHEMIVPIRDGASTQDCVLSWSGGSYSIITLFDAAVKEFNNLGTMVNMCHGPDFLVYAVGTSLIRRVVSTGIRTSLSSVWGSTTDCSLIYDPIDGLCYWLRVDGSSPTNYSVFSIDPEGSFTSATTVGSGTFTTLQAFSYSSTLLASHGSTFDAIRDGWVIQISKSGGSVLDESESRFDAALDAFTLTSLNFSLPKNTARLDGYCLFPSEENTYGGHGVVMAIPEGGDLQCIMGIEADWPLTSWQIPGFQSAGKISASSDLADYAVAQMTQPTINESLFQSPLVNGNYKTTGECGTMLHTVPEWYGSEPRTMFIRLT